MTLQTKSIGGKEEICGNKYFIESLVEMKSNKKSVAERILSLK